MFVSRRRVLGLLLLLLVAPAAWSRPTSVAYEVRVVDIARKLYHVQIAVEGVTEPTVSLAIPAWSPGYYILANFAPNIANVGATGTGGTPLPVQSVDPLTWRVETRGADRITVGYDLTAADRNYGFLNAYLDENNGYVAGPAALMYVVGGKDAPCRVTYRVPAGWKIASANAPTDSPNTFTAPDYDTLIDHPADLGRFARYDREIGGVPIGIILVGAEGKDHREFVDNVFKIARTTIELMGGAPFPRYVFHFRFLSRGGMQGLEHLNATIISLPPRALTEKAHLSIIAHEFVHAWNVKRIRPQALGPFDYTGPVRVKDLWWLEGVTDYYAPLVLVKSGIVGRDYWLSYMAAQIEELQNNPARRNVTLEQASLKAWEGGSEGYAGLSYYNKGLVVGLLLDIEMRSRTENRVGLHDVMLALMEEYRKTGRGYDEGGLEATASRVAGFDLKPFFDRTIRSTEELPIAESLAAAGLSLKESVTGYAHLGVSLGTPVEPGARRQGIRVESVQVGSAADRAGLKAGDTITAIDRTPVASLRGGLLADRKPGERVVIAFVREGKPYRLPVVLDKREERAYTLKASPDATPRQKAIAAALSGGARAETAEARR